MTPYSTYLVCRVPHETTDKLQSQMVPTRVGKQKTLLRLVAYFANSRSDSWLTFFSWEFIKLLLPKKNNNFARLGSWINPKIDIKKFKIDPSKRAYAISCTRMYNNLHSILLAGAIFREEEIAKNLDEKKKWKNYNATTSVDKAE